MKWVKLSGGLALYVNGEIVGWVTSTINGKYLYGVIGQTTRMKESTSFHDAKLKLESVFM